jgi:hypothetical protein
MNQVIIANVVAPTLLIDSVDNALVILAVLMGILWVEWLAVLWFCKGKLKLDKTTLFFLILTANLVSGFFGYLFRAFTFTLYAAFNLANLGSNLVLTFIACILSIFIEYWVYREYKFFRRNKLIQFQAVAIANITSYLFITIYIIAISIGFPQPTKYYLPMMESHIITEDIINAQKIFYVENKQFTSSFAALKPVGLVIDKQNNTKAESYNFIYTLTSDRTTAEITLIPNSKSESLKSYITLLRSEPFSSQTCEFSDDMPMTPPQIVDGKIECPPGSRKLDGSD